MAALQESDYGAGRDYNYGSPHLSHPGLHARILGEVTALVHERLARKGRCKVVEIGAGHGPFTHALVDAGATVTVTEMSEPSARLLSTRFADNSAVTVVHDPTGDAGIELTANDADLVVMISVLHHIPDYLDVTAKIVASLKPGGGFYSAQDPTWYPQRTRTQHLLDRGAYMAWRVTQGNVSRGVATRLRRLRGTYSSSAPSDMVEYHVVRSGVDQNALAALLEERFESVRLRTYWSTQSHILQRVGDQLGWKSNFAITATERLPTNP